MGKFFAVIGGFVGGFVIGWCVALLGYIIATSLFGMHDRDGGGAMVTGFVIGPFLGVITGIAGAFLVMSRLPRSPAA